jgi:hypothetical protein
VLLPAANMPKKGDAGIELLPVRRLTEALERLEYPEKTVI